MLSLQEKQVEVSVSCQHEIMHFCSMMVTGIPVGSLASYPWGFTNWLPVWSFCLGTKLSLFFFCFFSFGRLLVVRIY